MNWKISGKQTLGMMARGLRGSGLLVRCVRRVVGKRVIAGLHKSWIAFRR